MDMKKYKPGVGSQINTSNFIQTQNINFTAGSAKANYRDRANQNKKNIGGFDNSGFSVNSPFLSKTLKGMLGGPTTAAQQKQKKKTSVQSRQRRDSAKGK